MKIWKSLRILALIISGMGMISSALGASVTYCRLYDGGMSTHYQSNGKGYCVDPQGKAVGAVISEGQFNEALRTGGKECVTGNRSYASKDLFLKQGIDNTCKICCTNRSSIDAQGSPDVCVQGCKDEAREAITVEDRGKFCALSAPEIMKSNPELYTVDNACFECCGKQAPQAQSQCKSTCVGLINKAVAAVKQDKAGEIEAKKYSTTAVANTICATSVIQDPQKNNCESCCVDKAVGSEANKKECINTCNQTVTMHKKASPVTRTPAPGATSEPSSGTVLNVGNTTQSCDAAYTTCMSKPGHTGCQKARTDCNANARKAAVVAVPPAANVGRVQAAQNCNKTFQACKKGAKGAALQACNQAKASCIKAIP